MKYVSIAFISVLAMLLISSVGLAAPTINGSFSAAEWTADGAAHFANADGYLAPGTGGQDFDVEYIGLFVDDTHLYFGLQTGFELNYKESAGGQYFYPGDIALDFSPVGDSGKNYQLGFRFSISGIQDQNFGQSSVEYIAELETYFNPKWSDPTLFPQSGPYRVSSGETINPDYEARYQRFGGTSYDPHHNTLEASINLVSIAGKLAQLGIGQDSSYDVKIHWTMECGNDYLDQTFTFNAQQPIPEPATMLLLGPGLVGLAGFRRKLKK